MNPKNLLKVIGVIVVVVIVVALWSSRDTSETPVVTEDSFAPQVITEPAPVVKKPVVVVPKPAPQAGSVPTTPTATPTVPSRVLENGQYVSLVSLTAKGFDPQAVNIAKGESVRFINKSGSAMRILSTSEYAGLSQEKSVGQGGTYDLAFTKAGTWTFYNSPNKSIIGVVNVQ